jgi:hypothetical protein
MCCWPLPAQFFSDPSPLGLETIFYCLRFETSLFVASYDSQGHGGGIRPRLHTGIYLTVSDSKLLELPRDPHRRHHAEHFIVLCCPVGCHGNPVFSSLLPGNDSFAAILCNGNVISESLLRNGCVSLARPFRLSAVTS